MEQPKEAEVLESKQVSMDKTPKGFSDAYQKLCEEYGYRIVVSPAYIGRDDGTWSTVLQYSVGELPKKQ